MTTYRSTHNSNSIQEMTDKRISIAFIRFFQKLFKVMHHKQIRRHEDVQELT